MGHLAETDQRSHWRVVVSLQVTLLRSKLTELLDNFLQPEFKDLLGLMEIMGHLLHRLGVHGIGIASFKIAQHLLRLFTDVSWEVGGVGWQSRAGQGRAADSNQKPVPLSIQFLHQPQSPPKNTDSVDWGWLKFVSVLSLVLRPSESVIPFENMSSSYCRIGSSDFRGLRLGMRKACIWHGQSQEDHHDVPCDRLEPER